MTDFNISGVGAGTPAGGVGKVNDEETVKKPSGSEEAKKHIKQATDENEQVELAVDDDKDDGKISFTEKVKSFLDGLKNGLNKLFGKKENGGMKEIYERHQELQQRQQELMQQAVDIADDREKLIEEQQRAIEEALDKIERDSYFEGVSQMYESRKEIDSGHVSDSTGAQQMASEDDEE